MIGILGKISIETLHTHTIFDTLDENFATFEMRKFNEVVATYINAFNNHLIALPLN